MQFSQRVIGCFKALATGDAIGKKTETLSRADVQRWYPGGIGGFHGQPGEVIPRYAGKRYEWRIGETTDDTEQLWRWRERFCVTAGPLTKRSDRNSSNAKSPYTPRCHCGRSCSLVIHLGSHPMATAAELP